MYKKRLKITRTINQYNRELKKSGISVSEIILFGSYAKGNPRQDSDIDLLIISDDFVDFDLRRRLEILGVAAVRIMEPIEAIGYTPEEIMMVGPANFISEVIESGVKMTNLEEQWEK